MADPKKKIITPEEAGVIGPTLPSPGVTPQTKHVENTFPVIPNQNGIITPEQAGVIPDLRNQMGFSPKVAPLSATTQDSLDNGMGTAIRGALKYGGGFAGAAALPAVLPIAGAGALAGVGVPVIGSALGTSLGDAAATALGGKVPKLADMGTAALEGGANELIGQGINKFMGGNIRALSKGLYNNKLMPQVDMDNPNAAQDLKDLRNELPDFLMHSERPGNKRSWAESMWDKITGSPDKATGILPTQEGKQQLDSIINNKMAEVDDILRKRQLRQYYAESKHFVNAIDSVKPEYEGATFSKKYLDAIEKRKQEFFESNPEALTDPKWKIAPPKEQLMKRQNYKIARDQGVFDDPLKMTEVEKKVDSAVNRMLKEKLEKVSPKVKENNRIAGVAAESKKAIEASLQADAGIRSGDLLEDAAVAGLTRLIKPKYRLAKALINSTIGSPEFQGRAAIGLDKLANGKGPLALKNLIGGPNLARFTSYLLGVNQPED
jgi:hypothetical protein